MELRFTYRKRVFNVTIGFQSAWYSSSHFIDVIEETWCNRELMDARLIYSFFLRRKRKKISLLNEPNCKEVEKSKKILRN
jgi:hypothetical protein